MIQAASIYEFTANDIDGNIVSLEKYRDHVCIIVNVATKWGKTDVNYKQLVEVYKKVCFNSRIRLTEVQIVIILSAKNGPL